MGSKHDILTEEEMSKFRLASVVDKEIRRFIAKQNGSLRPEQMNILDWGCGRGRSVAKLREQGYNAFGVDLDKKTIGNGFQLFENRGFNPREILKPVSEIDTFVDGFFQVIFSEQVFEHVSDLEKLISVLGRKTAPGGIGIHAFPGAKNIEEQHLKMRYVHWLPKNILRKVAIITMLSCGKGPDISKWPEAQGKSFLEKSNIFYRYLNEKTYYRDNNDITNLFKNNGFDSKYLVGGKEYLNRGGFTDYFKRNGYPSNNVIFLVTKNKYYEC